MKKTRLERKSGFGPRTTELRRRTGVKKRNAARRKKESARANGDSAYREWLHAQPCAVCGHVGATEEAHAKNGGMGRKANAHVTLPMCGVHQIRFPAVFIPAAYRVSWVEGCHREQHRIGTKAFEARHGVNLLALAEQTQARWLSHQSASRQGG